MLHKLTQIPSRSSKDLHAHRNTIRGNDGAPNHHQSALLRSRYQHVHGSLELSTRPAREAASREDQSRFQYQCDGVDGHARLHPKAALPCRNNAEVVSRSLYCAKSPQRPALVPTASVFRCHADHASRNLVDCLRFVLLGARLSRFTNQSLEECKSGQFCGRLSLLYYIQIE
jgi:hypothetical protein